MMNIESVLKKVGFDVLSISNEFSLSQQVLSFNPDIVVGYGKGPKVSTVGVGRRLKEMPRWTGRSVLIFSAGSKTDPLELARCRMDMALEAPMEVTRLLQVLANLTQQDPQVLIERMMKAVAAEAQNQVREGADAAAAKSDAGAVFVTGGLPGAKETWDVKSTKEIEEFNRMMGGDLAPAAKAPVPSPAAPKEPAVSETPPAPTTSLRQQMEEAASKLSQKVKGYAKFLQTNVPTNEGLKRTDVRKAQKDLQKDWVDEKLKSMDQQRRDFTAALFKKKD